jgi:hypothetical protein
LKGLLGCWRRTRIGSVKEQIIVDLVLLLILIMIAGVSFWAGWRCAKAAEARRRYREEHPKYLHSGGDRDPA